MYLIPKLFQLPTSQTLNTQRQEMNGSTTLPQALPSLNASYQYPSPNNLLHANNNPYLPRGYLKNYPLLANNNGFILSNTINKKNGSQPLAPLANRVNAVPTNSEQWVKPKLITVVRATERPRKKISILLNKKALHSFEQFVCDISEAFGLPQWKNNKIRKIYTIRGKKVQSISEFFREDDIFIGVSGKEPLKSQLIKDLIIECYPDNEEYAQAIIKEWESSRSRSKAIKSRVGNSLDQNLANSNMNNSQTNPKDVGDTESPVSNNNNSYKKIEFDENGRRKRKKKLAETDLLLEMEMQRQRERVKLIEMERKKREQALAKQNEKENKNYVSVKRVNIITPNAENESNNSNSNNNQQQQQQQPAAQQKTPKKKPKFIPKKPAPNSVQDQNDEKSDTSSQKKSIELPPIVNEEKERLLVSPKNQSNKSKSPANVPNTSNKKETPREQAKENNKESIKESNKENQKEQAQVNTKEQDKQQQTNANKEKLKQQSKPDLTNKLKRQISNASYVTEKYELVKVLGDGNFAVVHQAKLKNSDHEYAIKIIDKSKMKGKEHMIDNEIFIMKSCNHPNIVKLHEEFETKNEVYLVTDLVKGGDLFDAISHSVKFSEKDAASMIQDICEALFYLHSKSIVHRDLKPENLLVMRKKDDKISIKLADFGLAMQVKEPIFTVCGTPTYVAPEILSEIGYGLEVDMWACGVITYILLCGFPPFRSLERNQEELFQYIQSGEFEYLMPYWEGISETSKDLINHLLVVDIKKRWKAEDVLVHPWIVTQGNTKPLPANYEEFKKDYLNELKTKAQAYRAEPWATK